MLSADPDLKPTTAIKAIGISDPSTIRRLRDKLRGTGADREDAIGSSGQFERDAGSAASMLGDEITAAECFVRTLSGSGEAPETRAEAPEREGAAFAPREGRREAAVSWFAAWCGLGLQAISTTVEAQMAVLESFLSVPQIASAIRHHALLNEQVMAFYSHGTDVRKTLH
jgi:hypothetical protein